MKWFFCSLVGLLALSIVSCGGSKVPAKDTQEISVVKNTYQEFFLKNKQKKATGPEDLRKYAEPAEGPIIDKVAAGDIVVIWNLSEADMKKAQPPVVVAYGAKAPSKGGPVMLSDFTVKTVTAKEFAALPQAQPK